MRQSVVRRIGRARRPEPPRAAVGELEARRVYAALSADVDGLLANVLTVFPLSAPLVLPARSALVGVPLWEHVTALALVVGATYALVRFAGRVYGQGCSGAVPASAFGPLGDSSSSEPHG